MMVQMASPSEQLDPDRQANGEKHGSFWRTALLLTTSAAFGGIAVAIWNRRTLARMRQESASGSNRSVQEKLPDENPSD
jgi:hypothetical protein